MSAFQDAMRRVIPGDDAHGKSVVIETRIKPGQVVIQRGTNHAWQAHGGPALLLAVLIDRPLKH